MNKVVKKTVDIFETATGERKASLKVAVGIRGVQNREIDKSWNTQRWMGEVNNNKEANEALSITDAEVRYSVMQSINNCFYFS